MIVVVFHGLCFGFDGFDVFGLDFVDHLEDVAGVPFEDGEEGAVGGWTVGADED